MEGFGEEGVEEYHFWPAVAAYGLQSLRTLIGWLPSALAIAAVLHAVNRVLGRTETRRVGFLAQNGSGAREES